MIPIRDTIQPERTPVVTWALIVANVAMFFWQLSVQSGLEDQAVADLKSWAEANDVSASLIGAQHVQARMEQLYALWLREWALVPAELFSIGGLGEYKTLFTAMFLHGGWMHLIGNMLFLHIFGDNIEDRLGHVGFVVFYLATGLAADGAQIVIDPGSTVPMVGASGAIAGVLGGYLVLFPRARVLMLVPIFFFIHFVEIPALLFLVFWFVFQNFIPAVGTTAEVGGVAYWAHMGGFVAGAAWCLLRRPALTRRPVHERHARSARPPARRGGW